MLHVYTGGDQVGGIYTSEIAGYRMLHPTAATRHLTWELWAKIQRGPVAQAGQSGM